MENELTKEEADRRAQAVARTLMSKPYQKQEWPKKPKVSRAASRSDGATPRKRGPTGEAS